MFANIIKGLVAAVLASLLSGCLLTTGGPRYQGEIERVQDRIVENAVDATTCGASSLMDKAVQRLVARGNSYNNYANQANFIACRAQERAQRQQEYWQAQARAEQRRMEQRQNAPQCYYTKQGGKVQEYCTERVYEQWR